MTISPCSHGCGEYVENTLTACPKCGGMPNVTSIKLATAEASPEAVGAEIRRLLKTLRTPGHTEAEEKEGVCNYATDILRAKALDVAQICWGGSGELHSAKHPCNLRPKKLDDPTWQPVAP